MIDHMIFLCWLVIAILFAPLMGKYMAYLFSRDLPLNYYEFKLFNLLGINPRVEMDWKKYLNSLLLMNLFGFLLIFLIQLTQGWLPLNPQKFPHVPFWLAFNTAASFVTNTNLQAYPGETTLSYFSQMVGLTPQNFLSAATGLCALAAFTRGLVNKSPNLGNFYVDITRSIFYILLPLSILFSVALVYEGVIQNFSPYLEATTLEGAKQIIPMGPVASQEAIKILGTNGGGFFNVNSAHPFENPTYLSNVLQTVAIFFLPAACVFMFGSMIKNPKKAHVLFFVMIVLWIFGMTIASASQMMPYQGIDYYPLVEGQETRFFSFPSVLWSVLTTDTSNGSVNSMISSLIPISGGVSLLNMMLGELIFGGVGVGMLSMLMYTFLTVFLAGLMVGRTPEYLGKKIEKTEMQWVMLAILAPSALILIGAGICILLPGALSQISQAGPHGFTEFLYSFTSASANNGSSFAGFDANTLLLNTVLGIIMILARISILVPALAIAGLQATKKKVPYSLGTFKTDTNLFAILLISVILIFAGLTFFPALILGPVLEQLSLMQGMTF